MKIMILVLLIPQLIITPVKLFPVKNTSSSTEEFLPMQQTEYKLIEGNADDVARRRLAPFQLCLLCKCCAVAATNTCVNMPCCFGIDCQLPNKPYGVCAFVPKTCNCASCAI